MASFGTGKTGKPERNGLSGIVNIGSKIEENMARDLRDDQLLMQAGWVPIHFWEKEVIKDLSTCVATIEEVILAQLIDSADTQEAIDYEG